MWEGYSLGMDVVFRSLRDVVVHRLELIKNILDCLHQDGLKASRERVGVVRIILRQGCGRFGLGCPDGVLARLSLKNKLADRVDVT